MNTMFNKKEPETRGKVDPNASNISKSLQPVPNDPIYDLYAAASILNCNERIPAQNFRAGIIPVKKKLGNGLLLIQTFWLLLILNGYTLN